MTSRTATARGGGLVTAAATGFAVVLLASCSTGDGRPPASSPPPPASATSPRPDAAPPHIANAALTATDHGSAGWLRVGETATLQLANPIPADPDVRGDAVRLVAVVNVDESSAQQWEIHALHPGSSRISAKDGRGRTVVLTIDVR